MAGMLDSKEELLPSPSSPRRIEKSTGSKLPHGFKLCVILLSLGLSILLVALDTTVIATTIPKISDEFRSLDRIYWYGSAYFLTCVAFQAIWGTAHTYFDTKTTFTVGIGVIEIGTLICALSQNSTVFLTGRTIAGIGGAALASGAFSIMAKIATPRKRALYIGFMGVTFGVASVVGPLLGSFFTDYTKGLSYSGWRCCFWINIPIGILASSITILFFRSPPSKYASVGLWEKILHLDLFGVAPLLASMVCFLLPMQWGGTIVPWISGQVIGAFAGSLICLLIFIMVEQCSGDTAMMQGKVIKDSTILLNLIYMFFLSGLYMPAVYFLSIQFQALEGITAVQVGVQLAPLVLCVSLSTIIANTSISKLGWPGFWLVLGPVMATSGALLIFKMGSGADNGYWILFQILLGLGVGFSLQTPMSINQSLVEAEDIPTVIGITLFFEMCGASFLIASCEAAFSNRLVVSLDNSDSSINPMSIIESGMSRFQTIFASGDLDAVLNTYQDGLGVAYLAMVACGCITFFVSLILILRRKTRQDVLLV